MFGLHRRIVAVLHHISKPILCICLLVVFHGCVKYAKYFPDPVKDIDQWVNNFAQQRSFKYEYEMKTRSVRVSAKGECVIGVGEQLSGQWESDGSVQEFSYIGLGDVEYSHRGGKWEVSVRGEESDVFTQITRLLSLGKFEYAVSDREYSYQFKANVPFLAPDRRKEMIGHVRISPRNYLPEFIWAGLPDSTMYWTAYINSYNTQKTISAPLTEYRAYTVLFEGVAKPASARAVKQRLDLCNIPYRAEGVAGGLLIRLPIQYQLEDAVKLLRPGGLAVYGVALDAKEAQRTAYLKDNMYSPVYLSEFLFDETEVRDAKVRFDAQSRPYIDLKLRRWREMPSAIAFEIDSVVIATATLDTLSRMDRISVYPDMQYHEIEILRAYIKRPLGALRISLAGGE